MKHSFIVDFWSRIFAGLSRLSVFGLLSRLFPGAMTARTVDLWVLGHLVLALLAVALVAMLGPDHLVSMALVFYGLLRVFEIAVYQINVLLFDEYRAVKMGRRYAITGYRRMIVLLLHNYAEVIFWLACTYTLLADEFVHKWEGGAQTMLGAVYSSFITMTTFGEFDLLPRSNMAAVILLFHSAVGLFMTLLSLARFISLIPEPETRDTIERIQIELGKQRSGKQSAEAINKKPGERS